MIGLVLVFGVIIILDFLPLLKYKDKKAIITFSTIFVFSIVVAALLVNDVNVPSMYELMHSFFSSIGLSW